jgi:hypothetical protein
VHKLIPACRALVNTRTGGSSCEAYNLCRKAGWSSEERFDSERILSLPSRHVELGIRSPCLTIAACVRMAGEMYGIGSQLTYEGLLADTFAVVVDLEGSNLSRQPPPEQPSPPKDSAEDTRAGQHSRTRTASYPAGQWADVLPAQLSWLAFS